MSANPRPPFTPAIWTPVQRIFQLNEWLGRAEYGSLDFWERLVGDFFGTDLAACSLRLSLECPGAPIMPTAIDIPRCLLPRWFWLWAQTGLVRLTVQVERLNETMLAGSQILVSSPALRLTSTLSGLNGSLVQVEHVGVSLMRFSATGRIMQWDLSLRGVQEFFSIAHVRDLLLSGGEPLEQQRISGFPRPFFFYQEMVQVVEEMLPLRELSGDGLLLVSTGGKASSSSRSRSRRRRS